MVTATMLIAFGFARQQCRAWIETCQRHPQPRRLRDSPGSNAGRGLKLQSATGKRRLTRFARQQCRAWIETSVSEFVELWKSRFARQQCRAWIETGAYRIAMPPLKTDSPGSNAGRGLKLRCARRTQSCGWIRPAAMPRADLADILKARSGANSSSDWIVMPSVDWDAHIACPRRQQLSNAFF